MSPSPDRVSNVETRDTAAPVSAQHSFFQVCPLHQIITVHRATGASFGVGGNSWKRSAVTYRTDRSKVGPSPCPLHNSTLLNWQYQFGTPRQESAAGHTLHGVLVAAVIEGQHLGNSAQSENTGLFSVLVTSQDASQVVNTSECGVSGEWCPPALSV